MEKERAKAYLLGTMVRDMKVASKTIRDTVMEYTFTQTKMFTKEDLPMGSNTATGPIIILTMTSMTVNLFKDSVTVKEFFTFTMEINMKVFFN